MERKYKSLIYAILLALVMQSCIKDPPINPEADIEEFSVQASQLTGDVFIDQDNRTITLNLTEAAFNDGITPEIKLSQGARIEPASGTKIIFNNDVKYVVTSASGV